MLCMWTWGSRSAVLLCAFAPLLGGCGGESPAVEPPPGDSVAEATPPALTGKRATAAARYLAAQRMRSADQPWLQTKATRVTVPFEHPEGFPKAWLAPDEQPAWPPPDAPGDR